MGVYGIGLFFFVGLVYGFDLSVLSGEMVVGCGRGEGEKGKKQERRAFDPNPSLKPPTHPLGYHEFDPMYFLPLPHHP